MFYGVSEEVIQLAVACGWAGLILSGSIMAVRGRRMWATSMLLIGATCTMIGLLTLTVVFFGMSGGPISTPQVMEVVLMLMAFLFPIGMLLVSIGFVGVCARFGLAERRAQELEVLVAQLQQRINSGS